VPPVAGRFVCGIISCALLLAHGGRSARAEESGDAEARHAVEQAANAFEYRDFQRVVDVLTPWIHPALRIADAKQRIVARRLLGITLHVLGKVPEAKEEFSQLLQDDPLHRLDPAVVPPQVIETFETVRTDMKPTLERLLKERGQKPDPPDEGPKKVVVVQVPPRFVLFAPLGFPQIALDEIGLGVALGAIQAVALVANIAPFLLPRQPEGSTALTGLRVMQYAGLIGFFATYGVSIVLAQGSYEAMARAGDGKQAPTQRSSTAGAEVGILPLDRGLGLSFSTGF
jgi:hypothetical protein